MLKIIAVFIFCSLVQIPLWQSEREPIREKLQNYLWASRITEQYITKYQMVRLTLKSSAMTAVCMIISSIYWALILPG